MPSVSFCHSFTKHPCNVKELNKSWITTFAVSDMARTGLVKHATSPAPVAKGLRLALGKEIQQVHPQLEGR